MARPSARPIALYTHAKGKQWGLAILAWERGSSRAYQFEDGALRIFNESYYSLLEEIDAPADRTTQIVDDLRRKLGDVTSQDGTPAPPAVEPELSFDDQVRAFRKRYPNGFADTAWIAKHRERTDGRRLKGHAEAAFADAQELFGPDKFERPINERRASELVAGAVALLERTGLLSTVQIEPLRALPPSRHVLFSEALHDLLHGDVAYELRFERFVTALTQLRRPGPTWQLVTALPALVWPTEQICVKPTTFREQARWMAPRLVLGSTPSGSLYLRLADMARSVKTALERKKLGPRDLMDVHQFMVMSLGSASKTLAAENR